VGGLPGGRHVAERIRPEQTRELVLAGWGFFSASGRVLLSLMAGSKEDTGRWRLVHRIRNLAAKVPEDVWPGFKAPATATDQAPSRPNARELVEGLVKITGVATHAVACFMDNFGACFAHLRMPITHRLRRGNQGESAASTPPTSFATFIHGVATLHRRSARLLSAPA
jgi:putative transposase